MVNEALGLLTVAPAMALASTPLVQPLRKVDLRPMACLPRATDSSIPKKVVLGCGTVVVDYLASVASYPQPDEKIRTVDFQFQGGGNVGNSLTGASRLGLRAMLVSKVADDPLGDRILQELETDGVDTSHVVVAEGGVSPFTYVIIDKEHLTRTCIHTPGYPAMHPNELASIELPNLLSEVDLVFFDARITDTAIEIAKKASELGIPMLIDCEKKREYLDELLTYVDYMVASAKFPEAWTGARTIGEALLAVVTKLPKLKFVVVTLGENGCIMLDRRVEGDQKDDKIEVNSTLESLRKSATENKTDLPVVVSSKAGRLVVSSSSEEPGILGRLIVATSQNIPVAKLVDTTGAGDAFISGVMYSLCMGFTPERMLPLAATVAAANCQAVGARAGMPKQDDPRIIQLLYGVL